MKLIDLKGMSVCHRHEPSRLVDDAALAESEQGAGIVCADGVFKFAPREPIVRRWPLDGQESRFIAKPHTHGAPPFCADVALHDVGSRGSEGPEIPLDEEFPFNFQGHRAAFNPSGADN